MKVTLPRQDGTACENCGHPHHDGTLWLEVRDYNKQEPYFIKACECCRCKSCREQQFKLLRNRT